jgi:hypothetical protein
MADDRQPFADELKDDAYFATALKDDAHFAPASFNPQQAPPAQGGGGGLPFWAQGPSTSTDTPKFATGKEAPKDMGAGTIPGGGDYTSDDVRKAVEGATAANDVLQKQKQADMGGRIKDLQSTMEDMRKNKPPVLERNKPPPKADFSASSMAYMQVAALMGALAGGFSRKGTTTALTAFSGMMKGLHEGNVESFNQMHQEWKEAEQNVNDVNQAKLDEYNAVWKDQQTNIAQKMEMMKLVATKYDDQITYNTAKMHDFTKLAEFQQTERDHHEDRVEKSKVVELQTEKLKKQIEQMNGVNEDALIKLADRVIDGDPSALAQMGRSTGSMTNAQNMIAKRLNERGLTVQDLEANKKRWGGDVSQSKLAGSMEQRVLAATGEVQRAIPIALEASNNMPRGKAVPLNILRQKEQQYMSDPKWNAFLVANQTLAKAYGRAMNPQGIPRVSEAMESEKRGFLDMAQSPEAYKTQLQMLWREVQNSMEAVRETRTPNNAPVGAFPDVPSKQGGGVIKYDAQGNRVQ